MKQYNKCDQCGTCCKIFYINLNEIEYNSKQYKTVFSDEVVFDDFTEAGECGANFLDKNDDGSCIYLKDNSCSIHAKRPQVCRAFFCDSKDKEFDEMHRLIAKHKQK